MGIGNDLILHWEPVVGNYERFEVFSMEGLSTGWPDPDPWGEPHQAEVLRVPPGMMNHLLDPWDLTITANHQDSLSVTVMIGNDSGLKYSDDGWRLMPSPERGWVEPGLDVYWQHW